MASIAEGELLQRIVDAALALLKWAEGNTELARGSWDDAVRGSRAHRPQSIPGRTGRT